MNSHHCGDTNDVLLHKRQKIFGLGLSQTLVCNGRVLFRSSLLPNDKKEETQGPPSPGGESDFAIDEGDYFVTREIFLRSKGYHCCDTDWDKNDDDEEDYGRKIQTRNTEEFKKWV